MGPIDPCRPHAPGNATTPQCPFQPQAFIALHTILHVEDRYGFPILPLCTLLLVTYGERSIRQYRALGWRSIGPVALYAVAAWALFVVQIVVWDQTTFY